MDLMGMDLMDMDLMDMDMMDLDLGLVAGQIQIQAIYRCGRINLYTHRAWWLQSYAEVSLCSHFTTAPVAISVWLQNYTVTQRSF